MTYIVKKGDTLYGISNQFGVSVTELARLNNIYGSNLQIGQVLEIPDKSGTNPDAMFMYTVKKGDTLYSIAKKYNTTVDKIKDINHLTSTNLSVGQVIRIPEMYTKEEDMVMPDFINYVVKKGDTLYSLAKKNNITVGEIISDNNLYNKTIKVGDTLKIRVPSNGVGAVEECFGEEYIPNEKYIVKKGDSLYSIAKRFNTTVDSIKKKNNLKSNLLQIGQELII